MVLNVPRLLDGRQKRRAASKEEVRVMLSNERMTRRLWRFNRRGLIAKDKIECVAGGMLVLAMAWASVERLRGSGGFSLGRNGNTDKSVCATSTA